MGIIAEVMNLLRPPAPAPEEPAPLLPTLEDLHAALDRMVQDRAQAESLIASAPRRRAELLLQEGTDGAIGKLERSVDSAHLLIERIDTLRPELEQRIAALNAETRNAAWLAMRTRLITQAVACQITRQHFEQMLRGLFDLKLEATNAGFQVETGTIPWDGFGANGYRSAPPDVFAGLASALSHQRLVVIAKPKEWTLRFYEFTTVSAGREYFPTAYQAGQEAGFNAEMARYLVDKGLAEVVHGGPLPPAPEKKPGPRRTRAEQLRIEEIQRGGRRGGPAEPLEPVELPPEHPTRTWTPIDTIPGGI